MLAKNCETEKTKEVDKHETRGELAICQGNQH